MNDPYADRRARALANPCALAHETLDPEHGFLFRHRGRYWSAILTVNR